MKLNAKLINDPKAALEALMAITAALYTGVNRDTPLSEATEVAETCASMWRVCDELAALAGGAE